MIQNIDDLDWYAWKDSWPFLDFSDIFSGTVSNEDSNGALSQWRWQLSDDSIDMRYTYVDIDARQFTYKFLGEFFKCAIYGALPEKLLRFQGSWVFAP